MTMLSVFIVESPSWQGDIALSTELCRLPAGAIKLQFRKLNSILARAMRMALIGRHLEFLDRARIEVAKLSKQDTSHQKILSCQ